MAEAAQLSTGLFSAFEDKDDKCCDLDLKTRMIIGAIASGFGVLFGILAFVKIREMTTFAILYTISIVCAVVASFFFAGPKKHITALKECVAHLISTIVLVVAVVGIFVFAFALKGKSSQVALVVIMFLVEVVALLFFYITLYPLAWKAVKAFVGKIFKCA
jgi:hypothetical protein